MVARIAASLMMAARSAPLNMGVLRANLSRSTSAFIFTLRACTPRIWRRPATSGSCTATARSKRPGRVSAGSSTSTRFVAAITITWSLASKPSISTRIAFSVCSRSSWPPLLKPPPRRRPTASISSRKMMHGELSLACLNRSRTRLAPTPTNISTKSLPLMLKNGTSASPAMALASSVLPQPGGPSSSTPRGMRPPSFWKRLGFFRNSTISETSSFASSMPATSAKVACALSLVLTRCRLRPKPPSMPPGPPPAPRMLRVISTHSRPSTITVGRMVISTCDTAPVAMSTL